MNTHIKENLNENMKEIATALVKQNRKAIPESVPQTATVVPMESLNLQEERLAVPESVTQIATVPVESHAISSIIDADDVITPEIMDEGSKETEQIAFSSIQVGRYPDRPQATLEDLNEIIEPTTCTEKEYGIPVLLIATSTSHSICFNQTGIAGNYAMNDQKGLIVYEVGSGFWKYQTETGLWVELQIEELRDDMGHYIKSKTPDLYWHKNTQTLIDNCISRLRSIISVTNVFDKQEKIIHVGNGVLEYDSNEEKFNLRGFSPDDFSRNRAEYDYIQGAECPKFKGELLKSALEDDDIGLIQKYGGQCLVGRNLAQKLLMLRGTPGGGKSTFANIVDNIVGEKNVTELRVPHLATRFELARFIGKSLLVGRDVPGTFLNNAPAAVIKKLIGNDLLDAEKKSINGTYPLRGDFNIILTSNSRLHIKLDSDVGAWRRRLAIVDYEKPQPEKIIPEFDKLLLEEEGSGILAWFIEGAANLLKELSGGDGRMKLTERQMEKVDNVLYESDSIRAFASERLELNAGSDITGAEALTAYCSFCDDKGWQAKLQRHFERELPDIILELFRKIKHTSIQRDTGNQRGYLGLRFKPAAAPEASDGQIASEVATE